MRQKHSDEVLIHNFRESITYLADDSLKGRETGSSGEWIAAEYIKERFIHAGLQAAGEDGFFQHFSKKPHPPVQKIEKNNSVSFGMGTVKEIKAKNVIAKWYTDSKDWIVIGAHYDHLGMGDESSLFTEGREIHNGADDNASGVAMLLELAEQLKTTELNSNVLFIAFSGEEKGLWGSNYFCDHPTIDFAKVKYMLNFDMVGRMKEENKLAIYGNGTSPSWNEQIQKANSDSLNLVLSESGVGPSDHTSFYLADIPVLHFFTGQHEDYHKPSDDVDKINFPGMVNVFHFVDRLIHNADQVNEFVFTKTKDEDNENAPDFKVTLGVIPDYLFDGLGMRMDGVREDRPAHAAGMIKGDVVIKIGVDDVTDMKSYMNCLSARAPGDTSLVLIQRNGAEQEMNVIWD